MDRVARLIGVAYRSNDDLATDCRLVPGPHAAAGVDRALQLQLQLHLRAGHDAWARTVDPDSATRPAHDALTVGIGTSVVPAAGVTLSDTNGTDADTLGHHDADPFTHRLPVAVKVR